MAERCGASLRFVQYWVVRAGGGRLDRVDWRDRRAQGRVAAKHPTRAWRRRCAPSPTPSARTIGRFLPRHGVLDGQRRLRSLRAFVAHSPRCTDALAAKRAARQAAAPPRAPWPVAWAFQPEELGGGLLIYIRRTSSAGDAAALGHRWPIDRHWAVRFVRLEIDLDHAELRAHAVRRSAPTVQPHLRVHPYERVVR